MSNLKKFGVSHSIVPVNKFGVINVDKLEHAIQRDTGLITVMYANNEVGTIQPIDEIINIAKKHKILFHSDAVQTPGKIPINLNNIDLASFSAHKFYGPKGVGFLYAADNIKLYPLLIGGSQERKMRAGTENTAGIAALGLAMELANTNLNNSISHLTKLETYFKEQFSSIYPKAIYNGYADNHLPGLVSVTIPTVSSDILLVSLDMKGIAISSGSACSSGDVKPSSVLSAMNISNNHNISTLRISFGKDNTLQEIDVLLSAFKEMFDKHGKR